MYIQEMWCQTRIGIPCIWLVGSLKVAHMHTKKASLKFYVCSSLQRYLCSFRVHELKELLRSIGCSQRGRKNELFQRSNELLEHGSPKIQNKIREIYERSHYTKRGPFSHRTYRCSPTKPAPSPTHSYIVHPDVTYKPHPFFHKVDSIIRPTALCKYATVDHSLLKQFMEAFLY